MRTLCFILVVCMVVGCSSTNTLNKEDVSISQMERYDGSTGKGYPYDVFSNEVSVGELQERWGEIFETYPERFQRQSKHVFCVYDLIFVPPHHTRLVPFASIYLIGNDEVSRFVQKKWVERKAKLAGF